MKRYLIGLLALSLSVASFGQKSVAKTKPSQEVIDTTKKNVVIDSTEMDSPLLSVKDVLELQSVLEPHITVKDRKLILIVDYNSFTRWIDDRLAKKAKELLKKDKKK